MQRNHPSVTILFSFFSHPAIEPFLVHPTPSYQTAILTIALLLICKTYGRPIMRETLTSTTTFTTWIRRIHPLIGHNLTIPKLLCLHNMQTSAPRSQESAASGYIHYERTNNIWRLLRDHFYCGILWYFAWQNKVLRGTKSAYIKKLIVITDRLS